MAVLGMIVLLYLNVQHAADVWLTNTSVSLFLDPSLNEARRESVLAKVRRHPMVRTAQLVSPQQGLEDLADRLGARKSLFDEQDRNELPYTVDFEIYLEFRDRIDQIAGNFRRVRGVQEVIYAEQILDKVRLFFQLTQIVGLFFIGLILLSFCLIIANAIKLSMHSRIEEIEILTLIGSTRGFIHLGLIIEGMVISLTGGLVALGLVWASYRLLLAGLTWDALTQNFRETAVFYRWEIVGAALGIVVILGGAASYLSVNRVLREL